MDKELRPQNKLDKVFKNGPTEKFKVARFF